MPVLNKRLAVVLFNLGGPDNLDAVEPFLKNLFSDPAIIRVPGFIRPWLAGVIARKRAPVAKEIYQELGGSSPILPQTVAQAKALETQLSSDVECRVFVAMRYWHPRASVVAQEVAAYDAETTILLPLYPQFSSTTTASSIAEFCAELNNQNYTGAVRRVCCYPTAPGFIQSVAADVGSAIQEAQKKGPSRVLFSAHGLPESIVKTGDPYPWQVQQSVTAVVEALAMPGLDYQVCYQSRVGPMKWIGPSTEEEIRRGGADGKALVVVPIAFVSEHSETLVELDIEYRKLAEKSGAPAFIRVPTVGITDGFITSLAELVEQAVKDENDRAYCNSRICPVEFSACPNHRL